MKHTIILFVTLFFNTANADWHDDVRLGHPEYGGTGCPAGSASAALSPDAKSLSMLFDSFVVEAGGFNSNTVRKTCNVAVPVHVPNGYSVSIFQIDYRGFNSLPFGAYSRFNVEYFFAGAKGPIFRKTFNGELEEDFLIRNTLTAPSVSWSRCGEDVILRANSGMLVRTRNGEEAFSTIDSADVNAGLIFNLAWRECR